MKLANALLRAPDLEVNQTPSRVFRAQQHGLSSLDPQDMKPAMRETLRLVCCGLTNKEIAERTHYSHDTIRGRTQALLAIFNARNRAHLAALAVARRYVDMRIVG